MMSFLGLLKKEKKLVPLEQKETSIAPDNLLVRPNKYIPKCHDDEEDNSNQDPNESQLHEDEDDCDEETKDNNSSNGGLGREVCYETTVVFSPVYRSQRNKSSSSSKDKDKANSKKSLVISKDEMHSLTGLLNQMVLKDAGGATGAVSGDTPTMTSVEPDEPLSSDVLYGKTKTTTDGGMQYGRYTKTLNVTNQSEKRHSVPVTRSYRLSP